eukprot:4488689-Pyramimonas_sp.AAC.1
MERLLGAHMGKGIDVTCFGVERIVTTLGIAVGRGARDHALRIASGNVRARVCEVKALGLGLAESLIAYS